MMYTPRKWNTAELEMLKRLKERNKWPAVEMAKQFPHCTADDVQAALDGMQAAEPPKTTAEIDAAHKADGGLDDMDELQVLFYEHCRNYNAMGESLRTIAKLVGMSLTKEQLLDYASTLEKQYALMPEPRPPIMLYLISCIYAGFILVRRPVLQKGKPEDKPNGGTTPS